MSYANVKEYSISEAKATEAALGNSPKTRFDSMTPFTRLPHRMVFMSYITSEKLFSLNIMKHPFLESLFLLIKAQISYET